VANRRRAEAHPRSAPAIGAAADFAARRQAHVRALNDHADRVLAVSERTAEIARGFGVAPGRLQVLRIGTDQAQHWDTATVPGHLPRADGTLGLGYLGYMRRDKGFYFLLDALERTAPRILARLHVTIAAQSRDADSLARLTALAPRLASFRHVNGYTREALDGILDGVDLGVVPVLWEDTAPQVALEMHARRIPLLTTDRGGARELGAHPGLVVPAGDAEALGATLRDILDTGLDLGPYWQGALPPIRPEAHVASLLDLYRALR
jgi:glycosyltransferase involved in cell wall biosynthesis